MNTYEIKSLEGLKPIAEGYKAIKWDSGTKQVVDYLLKNGVIVPPVKVGQTVYEIQ